MEDYGKRLKGCRVLVAEDVAVNAELIREAFLEVGAEVECVENGQLAVDRFLDAPEGYYDAILMDIMMPVKDGLAAAAEIRESGRADSETVPIVALTGNNQEEDMLKSFKAGMVAHLNKPVDRQLMYEVVGAAVGRKGEN